MFRNSEKDTIRGAASMECGTSTPRIDFPELVPASSSEESSLSPVGSPEDLAKPRTIFGSYWNMGESSARSPPITSRRLFLPTDIQEEEEEGKEGNEVSQMDGSIRSTRSITELEADLRLCPRTKASLRCTRSISAPNLWSRLELRSCLRQSSLLNGENAETPSDLRRSKSSVSFSNEVRVTEFRLHGEQWAPSGWSKHFAR